MSPSVRRGWLRVATVVVIILAAYAWFKRPKKPELVDFDLPDVVLHLPKHWVSPYTRSRIGPLSIAIPCNEAGDICNWSSMSRYPIDDHFLIRMGTVRWPTAEEHLRRIAATGWRLAASQTRPGYTTYEATGAEIRWADAGHLYVLYVKNDDARYQITCRLNAVGAKFGGPTVATCKIVLPIVSFDAPIATNFQMWFAEQDIDLWPQRADFIRSLILQPRASDPQRGHN